MKKTIFTAAAISIAAMTQALAAPAVTGHDPADSPEALVDALVTAGSGITVVDGSEDYVGIEDQGGTFDAFEFSGTGVPTLSLDGGVALSSGTSVLPLENTDTAFSIFTDTGENTELTDLLESNGNFQGTNDQNVLSFSFTVDDSMHNAIQTRFIFGTDEFPDQDVTDAFAFFVDGVNFAEFSDGSLVTFLDDQNEDFFNDNTGDAYGYEMDGISNVLNLVGLLDPTLAVHTLSIVIADTSDSDFDSIVLLENMRAIFTDSDGGITPGAPVPVPGAALLFLGGMATLSAVRKKKA